MSQSMTPYNPINQWMLPIVRPHSAGPFTNYPVNYGALPFGDVETALDYLAGLHSELRLRNADEDAIIHEWVMQCPELDQRFRNALSPREISDAFHQVLDLVYEYQQTQGRKGIAERLYTRLQQALQVDLLRASIQQPGITPTCQHLFRALAYVSSRYRSTQLGLMLYQWFLDHLPDIIANNSPTALWQWCHAILDSSMNYELKQDCLSKLSVHCPDLFHASQIGANESLVRQLPQLIRELADVINDCRPSYRRSSSSYGPTTGDPWSRSHKSRRPHLRRTHSEELEDERRDLQEQLRRNEDAQRRLDRRYRRPDER